MSILYALQSLRTPFWDNVLALVTQLGEQTVLMVIVLVILWCIDKKWGYRLLFLSLAANILNQQMKVIWKMPRPWIRDPEFKVVEAAREAATGYSFPSGHTMGAVSLFGGLMIWRRKVWVGIVCVAAMLLVGFSRLYLGVHMPADVFVGLAAAGLLVAGMAILWEKKGDSPKLPYLLGGAALLVCCSLMLCLYLLPEGEAAFDTEGLKNGWTLTGCASGLCISWLVDKKWIHYETKAVWWAQILKCVLGGGVVMGVRLLLKAPMTALFGESLGAGIRYFIMVVAGGALWPMTFRWFGKLGKKPEQEKLSEAA